MCNVTQLVLWFNFLIDLPLNIKLIMLLIILKEWRIKLIQNYCKVMLIHSDGTLNLLMLKFLKAMIILVYIEMCLLILQLDRILWTSWKNKWSDKVVNLELWHKFKTFSRTWNLNTSEPPLKSYGFKISIIFANKV